MDFEVISPLNKEVLCAMFVEMWPDESKEDHQVYVNDVLQKDNQHAILSKRNTDYTGFIYLSLRSDFVPGATAYPVAYIEGIFIRPPYRKKGLATQLVQLGEKWGREHGSRQLASDVEISNVISQDFHQAMGFEEEDRVITYIKDID